MRRDRRDPNRRKFCFPDRRASRWLGTKDRRRHTGPFRILWAPLPRVWEIMVQVLR